MASLRAHLDSQEQNQETDNVQKPHTLIYYHLIDNHIWGAYLILSFNFILFSCEFKFLYDCLNSISFLKGIIAEINAKLKEAETFLANKKIMVIIK